MNEIVADSIRATSANHVEAIRGANARVHLARASMRKDLLLEAQSGQDFSAALECNLGFFVLRFI